MKGKITVLWLGKTAQGNGRLRVHCLSGMSGCPGPSEQDMAFPRRGYGCSWGRVPHSDCRNRLELESWLYHSLPGCPWVGPTSPASPVLPFKRINRPAQLPGQLECTVPLEMTKASLAARAEEAAARLWPALGAL